MKRFVFAFILCCGVASVFAQGKEMSMTPVAPDPC
jgi:hypothetical protein